MSNVRAEFEFAVARIPNGVGDALGGIGRVEGPGPGVHSWFFSLRVSAATPERLARCLALLVVDEAIKVLPHPLFPYQPPHATVGVDGKIRDMDGNPLAPATIREVSRVAGVLAHEHAGYIRRLSELFHSGEAPDGFSRLPEDHPLSDPDMESFQAPPPPLVPVRSLGR